MTNSKFLVTGGLGFIGSFIVNELIKRSQEVYVFTRSDEYKWRLDHVEMCNIIKIDITDYESVKNAIEKIKPDYIFHLAGAMIVDKDMDLIEKAIHINFIGTYNLLNALKDIDYSLFINTGSRDEYGNLNPPFKEYQREHPLSPYAFSKVTTTYLCEMVSNLFKKPIVTIRPFLTYGPKQMIPRLIPSLIYAGITDKKINLTMGEQYRDFTYVSDVAEAYLRIADNYSKFKQHEILNIGTDKPVKVNEVAKIIQNFFPKIHIKFGELPYREREGMVYCADITRLYNFLNFKPNTAIEAGIEKTIYWWKKNPDTWRAYEDIFNL